jgi:hypothetical protein
MQQIKILKCSDRLYWYSSLIGQQVPLLREYEDCYMSREPDGFANIVKKEDAEIVEKQ